MTANLMRFSPLRFALLLLLFVFAAFDSANAAKFSVLYTFKGGRGDGAGPLSRLIMDKEGNLFGVTSNGGGQFCDRHGCGTVFEITPSGTQYVLFAFDERADGLHPSGLAKDKDGTIYGTTFEGGSGYGSCPNTHCGAVFKLAPDGTETVLYSFLGDDDPWNPVGLAKDASGNLYGATQYGGGTGCYCGLIFEVAANGTESTLYTFAGGNDGANPEASPIMDAARNLYGTTAAGGGTGCGGTGCGTVYKVTPDGTETVLYAFSGGTDGAFPEATLTMDAAGNLLGTANGGGSNGLGVVFKLTPGGVESVLHSFAGGSDGDGTFFDGVRLDSSGNLYGATQYGGGTGCGGPGCGTVYKIAANGTEDILYAFTGGSDGANPQSDLNVDATGNLYGTAFSAGSNGAGVVFKITP